MNKILIIRFSSLGDVIHTTSILPLLMENFPNSQIEMLTLGTYASLFENNPYIQKVISLSRNTSIIGIFGLAKHIKQQKYTQIIDLHNSLRSKILRIFTLHEKWMVYRKHRLMRFSIFNLHFPKNKDGESLSIKYGDWIFGGKKHDPPTEIRITESEKQRAEDLLKEKGIDDDFVVFVPGAAWKLKLWKVEGYVELAKHLIKEKKIVLLGGNKDVICNEIAEIIPEVVNFRGRTTLRTAAAILHMAKCVVGSDTGLIHCAEAVTTPVVMITGPTSRETGAYAVLEKSSEVGVDLWCRPCSKNGSRPCYRTRQYCMSNITTSQIITALQPIIGE